MRLYLPKGADVTSSLPSGSLPSPRDVEQEPLSMLKPTGVRWHPAMRSRL